VPRMSEASPNASPNGDESSAKSEEGEPSLGNGSHQPNGLPNGRPTKHRRAPSDPEAAITLQRVARGYSGRRLATAEWQREVSGWLTYYRNAALGWSSRVWFVLQEQGVRYYRDESESKLLGRIDVGSARCFCTVPHGASAFCFRLTTEAGVKWLLSAESDDERRQWVEAVVRRTASSHAPEVRNRVLFMYGRGGGGHIASANAVRDCLAQDQGDVACDVKIVDLGTELEEPVMGAKAKWALKALRLPNGDDVYNICMSRGWYRFAEFTTRAGINAVEKNFEAIGDFMCDYFARERPALVVSFIPNINRVLRVALKHVLPGVRLLTVITDMETTPGHRWIDPFDATCKHTIVAGGERSTGQKGALGGAFAGQHGLLFTASEGARLLSALARRGPASQMPPRTVSL